MLCSVNMFCPFKFFDTKALINLFSFSITGKTCNIPVYILDLDQQLSQSSNVRQNVCPYERRDIRNYKNQKVEIQHTDSREKGAAQVFVDRCCQAHKTVTPTFLKFFQILFHNFISFVHFYPFPKKFCHAFKLPKTATPTSWKTCSIFFYNFIIIFVSFS